MNSKFGNLRRKPRRFLRLERATLAKGQGPSEDHRFFELERFFLFVTIRPQFRYPSRRNGFVVKCAEREKQMKKAKVIEKLYLELMEKKNIRLYSSIFHSDFKKHVFEGASFNYSEYENLLKKIFNLPIQISCRLKKETFSESRDQFTGQVNRVWNHQIKGKAEYHLSILAQFKREKIWDFRLSSPFDWTLMNYFMKPIADVLNSFEIANIDNQN